MFPIHLNLGFRVFYYYEGLYFAASVLVATLVAVRRLKRARLDTGPFMDSLLWILLGAFLGARVFHFVFWDHQAFLADPASFLRFWEGGVSITGGLAGGVSAAWFCLRRVDRWHYFAETIPAVLLGQAIGRVGCFLNGDAWGIPTSLPWGVMQPKFGVFVPSFTRDSQVPSDAWSWSVAQGFTDPGSLRTVPLHPTQFYEALGDLLLMGLVIFLVRSLRKTQGPWQQAAWLQIGGYSILRFGLEFLHADRDVTVWAGMTALQMVLLFCAVIASALYAKAGWRRAATSHDLLSNKHEA